jgi:ketosteroid isomerase-like protein
MSMPPAQSGLVLGSMEEVMMEKLRHMPALLLFTIAPATAAADMDRQAEEARIRAIDAAWVGAIHDRDQATIVEFYAPHGDLLVQNQAPRKGHAAIGEAWTQLLSMQKLDFTFAPTSITISSSGDMANDLGRIRWVSTENMALFTTRAPMSWCGGRSTASGRSRSTSLQAPNHRTSDVNSVSSGRSGAIGRPFAHAFAVSALLQGPEGSFVM